VLQVDAGLAMYSDPSNIKASMEAYFYALLNPTFTVSNKYVDQFSFMMPTADWISLTNQGADVGYGVTWTVSYQPNAAFVAWVEPGSVAEQAGLQRGDQLVSVDNADVGQLDAVTFYDSVFPASAGTAHQMKFARADGGGPDVMLSAAAVVHDPVPIVKTLPTESGLVGYMLFNAHDASAEAPLIDGINRLKAAGVTDLVLDLRYNRGGYLFIASELAYMVAGPARTTGRVFEKLTYNDKRRADNAQLPTPFYDTSCLQNAAYECTSVKPLPTLGLSRVYVLATDSTCSASEAIINGLRGVDVEVRIIGSTTCGKPYGFHGRDNCGISYFPMEFKGTNAKGFGDFADGFAPDCAVADDLSRPLGSPQEGLLGTALAYRRKEACPQWSPKNRQQVTASGYRSARVAHSPMRGLSVKDAAHR
jgi:carboxyl-terminal processing protease